VAASSGSPLSYTLFQSSLDPLEWRRLLDLTAAANDDGPPVTGQVFARPVGVLLGLDVSYNPFSAYPAYQRIADLPLAERVAEMRKPEVRQAILADTATHRPVIFFALARRFDVIYPLGNPPNYEPAPETSLSAQAQARGVSPDEIAYDAMLEDDGRALLLMAAANYENRTLDEVHAMLQHPNTVPGLGDGGAHYGMICDASFPTYLLQRWARDAAPAERIPLPQAIAALTSEPAALAGLQDRGRLAPGCKADINLIDLDRLKLHVPTVRHDLPAGGRRMYQGAEGYVATIVSGTVTYRNGEPTGALPGRLVRGQREAPRLAA
jgi:N-acyl-D-aspartate/D-glutamate deacylase